MLFAPTPPTCADLPRHVAVIMDGNGRWAKQRHRPRAFGHRAGVRSARNIVKACYRKGIAHLTLFAFSQENWQRPPAEVGLLMQLFANTLAREIRMLHDNTVRVRFIGDLEGFSAALRKQLDDAERLTAAKGAGISRKPRLPWRLTVRISASRRCRRVCAWPRGLIPIC